MFGKRQIFDEMFELVKCEPDLTFYTSFRKS